MYQPVHHREEDLATLYRLIEAHPLGLMTCNGPDGPVANAVPFLIDPGASPKGRLRAHLARANPQWQMLADKPDESVLVIFQGPESYITPSWYETKRQTGKVVPTWNYVMVQARGRARVLDDADWLADQIAELTDSQEVSRAAPWAVNDAPGDFIARQMRAIVGIEIDIDDIAGKWKVSQNRPEADRAGVAQGLGESEDTNTSQMAELVRKHGGLT